MRRRALIGLGAGVLALFLVAGVVGGFTLQPGRTFLFPTEGAGIEGQSSVEGLPADLELGTILRGILAVALVLLPISIIVSLFSKEGRRRLITNVITVVLLLFLMNQLQQRAPIQKEQAGPQAVIGELMPVESGEPLPPAPPEPPEWLAWAASAALVLLIGGLVFFAGRRLLFPKELPALAKIGAEAEKARRELDQGGAVEDVVVRCYRQMSRIVAEARELRRQRSTTPEEFAETLAAAGLPAGPLTTLTRLFEDVRYGSIAAGPRERQAALDSLEAIAAACRAARFPDS